MNSKRIVATEGDTVFTLRRGWRNIINSYIRSNKLSHPPIPYARHAPLNHIHVKYEMDIQDKALFAKVASDPDFLYDNDNDMNDQRHRIRTFRYIDNKPSTNENSIFTRSAGNNGKKDVNEVETENDNVVPFYRFDELLAQLNNNHSQHQQQKQQREDNHNDDHDDDNNSEIIDMFKKPADVHVPGTLNREEKFVLLKSIIESRCDVDTDEVFLAGDNRYNSIDSRSYGPQPITQLMARVFIAPCSADYLKLHMKINFAKNKKSSPRLKNIQGTNHSSRNNNDDTNHTITKRSVISLPWYKLFPEIQCNLPKQNDDNKKIVFLEGSRP